MQYRRPESRRTARMALAVYATFLVVLWAVWRLTTEVPRQDYSQGSQLYQELCNGSNAEDVALGREDEFQFPGIVTHLHAVLTLVVADPNVSGVVSWGEGAGEAAEVLTDFSNSIRPAGIRVTHEIQTMYYADRPLVSTSKVKEYLNTQKLRLGSLRSASEERHLQRDLQFLLYIEGPVPAADWFGEVTKCSALRGWGCVCEVIGARGGSTAARELSARELHTAFAHWRALLPRFLGWPETASAVQWLRATKARAKREVCRSVGALYGALDLIDGLPLPPGPHHAAVTALEALRGLSGDGAEATAAALRVAEIAAAAYFDPSLVSSVYFPPDHLVAIYLPFFFPACATVLLGFAHEVKRTRADARAAAAAPAALAAAVAATAAGSGR
eukprot:TRINITY_DN37080_c0_g1_i1.p2 TRINITY_DN37080_c0_g1~~TRINITY_DN37080_c0_g1_i1.p2  ORF type:complete len:387 (+),score=100.15 TRINITY_DN37080_c0_g1_i1:97-1257(+)